MAHDINNNYQTSYENEIDIKSILLKFWENKRIIIGITSFFAIFSILFSLSLPNIYTSSALLAPANENESLSSSMGAYSSLAGITGVRLPGDNSKSNEAIERIQSFNFFSNYFLPNIKLEDIMAVEEWVPSSNILLYNEEYFDVNEKKWIRKVKFPKKPTPSAQEAFKKYKEIIMISEDSQTGFVSISIKHHSPYVAKIWLDLIIFNINESMREEDKKDALNSISFLNNAIKDTNLNELKEAIASLLESQMKTLMLSSASEGYIYNIIDAPIVSEQKSEPSRAIICILITFFGGIISLLYLLLRDYFRGD